MEESVTPVIKKEKPIWKKWLLRILFSFIGFILLIVAIATIIVVFFEDEIEQYAIEKINEQINTKIEIRDVELSLIKKFPMASLEFKDAKCEEVSTDDKKEYIVEAKSIFLQFSIWDIFDGNYQFKKISIEEGKIDLEIDKKGKRNFDILKKDTIQTKKNENFKFNEFDFKNVHFSFVDKKLKQQYIAQIHRLDCSGNFSDNEFKLKSKGSITAESIKVKSDEFLKNNLIDLDVALQVNNSKKTCKIEKGDVSFQNMRLAVSGNFTTDSTAMIDLKFKGEDLNIQSFLSVLPEGYRTWEEQYKSNGDFYLEGIVKGKVNNGRFPKVQVNFGIKNAEIKFIETGVEMTDVNLKGYFDSGDDRNTSNTILSIQEFSSKMKNSTIAGNLYVKNFDAPEIVFNINTTLDLEEFYQFFQNEQIEKISGIVNLQLTYEGKLASRTFGIQDFLNSKTNGRAIIQNLNLKLKQEKLDFKSCNGEIDFENSLGKIKTFAGFIGSTDFSIQGNVDHLPEYIYLKNQPLIIKANLQTENLIVDNFLEQDGNLSKNEKSYEIEIPEMIDISLNASIKNLQFRKFKAANMKGELLLKNKNLFANNLQFNSCAGSATISGRVDASNKDNIVTEAIGSFKEINITELFAEFENFNQTTIEDKHLKGKISSEIIYKASFDKNLKMKLSSLYVYAPLTITNGELIDFKPLEGLSKFIRVEELRHIKFSTLTNNIEIRDEAVYIPNMKINSSALNLEIGGVHYFDNRIEYYFNLFLRDVLFGKMKKKRKTEDEFGEIIEEEGGARLYLSMVGTVDKYSITVDKKGVKEKIKEDLKKEQNTLKQLFYDDFGFFKNDSIIQKNNNIQKKEDLNKINSSDDFEFDND